MASLLPADARKRPDLLRQFLEVSLSEWVLLFGLAAVVVPTILRVGRLGWSTEAGSHGPIVLATGLWLIWRLRGEVSQGTRQPFLPAGIVLAMLLPLYVVGRITSILMLETLALYGILLTLAYLRWGGQVLRRFWFPIVYGLFLITPPENWVFVATRPLKAALSSAAVEALSLLGFGIGSTGTMIQIEGYQLLVATACSGINSLIGISAVSLFYVYLRHGDAPRYAVLLTLLVLPIAVLTNFIRILALILMTYWIGEDVAQGIAHELAGLTMFMVALGLFLVIDSALHPVFRRLAWTK